MTVPDGVLVAMTGETSTVPDEVVMVVKESDGIAGTTVSVAVMAPTATPLLVDAVARGTVPMIGTTGTEAVIAPTTTPLEEEDATGAVPTMVTIGIVGVKIGGSEPVPETVTGPTEKPPEGDEKVSGVGTSDTYVTVLEREPVMAPTATPLGEEDTTTGPGPSDKDGDGRTGESEPVIAPTATPLDGEDATTGDGRMTE